MGVGRLLWLSKGLMACVDDAMIGVYADGEGWVGIVDIGKISNGLTLLLWRWLIVLSLWRWLVLVLLWYWLVSVVMWG